MTCVLFLVSQRDVKCAVQNETEIVVSLSGGKKRKVIPPTSLSLETALLFMDVAVLFYETTTDACK